MCDYQKSFRVWPPCVGDHLWILMKSAQCVVLEGWGNARNGKHFIGPPLELDGVQFSSSCGGKIEYCHGCIFTKSQNAIIYIDGKSVFDYQHVPIGLTKIRKVCDKISKSGLSACGVDMSISSNFDNIISTANTKSSSSSSSSSKKRDSNLEQIQEDPISTAPILYIDPKNGKGVISCEHNGCGGYNRKYADGSIKIVGIGCGCELCPNAPKNTNFKLPSGNISVSMTGITFT